MAKDIISSTALSGAGIGNIADYGTPAPAPVPLPEPAITERPSYPMQRRWGEGVMKQGFLIAPGLLFSRQRELKLSAIELNVLLQLMYMWRSNGELPRPSKAQLAKQLRVTTKTVQRTLASLEEKKFLVRHPRRTGGNTGHTTLYDLKPMVKLLDRERTHIAMEKKQLRDERAKMLLAPQPD